MVRSQRFERLELKYHLTERQAEVIRRAIEPWCVPDAYNGPRGYMISSLYLDSPTLEFHRARLRNDRDRLKLRIRTYESTGPAQLEIKRKVGKIIAKERTAVARDALLVENGDDEIADLFHTLRHRTGAEPRLTVRYLREAWTSRVDSYARVTFDRNILAAAARPTDWTLHPTPDGSWSRLDRGGHLHDGVTSSVLLELKCEAFVPRWMSDLITRFELRSTGFSKYSTGVQRVGLGASQALPVWRS